MSLEDSLMVAVLVALSGVIGIFVSIHYFPKKLSFVTCALSLVIVLIAGYHARRLEKLVALKQFPQRLETIMMLYDGEDVPYERWERIVNLTNSLEQLGPFARALSFRPEYLRETLLKVQPFVRLNTNTVQQAQIETSK